MVTNCHQLKLQAEDGKMRFTDVANPETLLSQDSESIAFRQAPSNIEAEQALLGAILVAGPGAPWMDTRKAP